MIQVLVFGITLVQIYILLTYFKDLTFLLQESLALALGVTCMTYVFIFQSHLSLLSFEGELNMWLLADYNCTLTTLAARQK